MSDMVERLRRQSKFHNSETVMTFFAEAAEYVEQLERKVEKLKQQANANYGSMRVLKNRNNRTYPGTTFPIVRIINEPVDSVTNYERAMKPFRE